LSHPKTCQECLDLLTDYVDGELPSDLQGRLEEHFGDCQPCEDFVATYRATSSVCRKVLARTMPESVAARLRSFLRSEIEKDKASGG